eukprot:m.192877 g.192877  ORF g.192877 m.192877 type:complete len:59 (-) comp15173_c0_seq12:1469-1645(-)
MRSLEDCCSHEHQWPTIAFTLQTHTQPLDRLRETWLESRNSQLLASKRMNLVQGSFFP